CFVEDAAAQLQKVRNAIVGGDAIDCRVQIGAEGQEGDRGNTLAVGGLQACGDHVILKIGLF
ncbi:MAG: hypothetical protein HGB05_04085, partial [Chloroflexi bacterium]|nr:hypothetical protein [Chloroflexota bacterium]